MILYDKDHHGDDDHDNDDDMMMMMMMTTHLHASQQKRNLKVKYHQVTI